jgi:hypothetical protein
MNLRSVQGGAAAARKKNFARPSQKIFEIATGHTRQKAGEAFALPLGVRSTKAVRTQQKGQLDLPGTDWVRNRVGFVVLVAGPPIPERRSRL